MARFQVEQNSNLSLFVAVFENSNIPKQKKNVPFCFHFIISSFIPSNSMSKFSASSRPIQFNLLIIIQSMLPGTAQLKAIAQYLLSIHMTNVTWLKPILPYLPYDLVETTTIVLGVHPYKNILQLKPLP